MALRKIILLLDELDYNAIQDEIAYRQRMEHDGVPAVGEGDSNLPGAILAECVRDLDEYRALADAALREDLDDEG